ncbi:uncharacterized protein NDAI_0J01980 [Naumovozyma dairenensis CBS 421]|uniref:Uncharacterized protein n=1 Tax=Naumovozyma dairenensis (strain ATCC 10597 / BCRC 20456 / CBS 421 / NBRC 0211 / NRRL Y-12639) TaxID=1071378 RepID=G0WH12_NAUDC|nr:hypothetical protein NDAI_0J01980 [Naumovozyma dairenensis CBS 421]CCD27090.1 hypothetical protein NDAI_0J01980 [Naumovozyma dairenensis CBS 421]
MPEKKQQKQEQGQMSHDNTEVYLNRGGKTKVMYIDQLRRPHAVSCSPNFHLPTVTDTNNSGGLLLNNGHRPSVPVEVDQETKQKQERQNKQSGNMSPPSSE